MYVDNMPDLIRDSYSERYDDGLTEKYNIRALTIVPRYKIYTKLLKTNYTITEPGEQITNGELLALLLLHYGAITNEQFRILGISPDERCLYNMCYRNKKGLGTYPIEAKYDIGNEKAYTLKPVGYNRICGRLPREYLSANQISAMYSRDRKINQHQINMLNIVYATIADGMPPFYWHGYTDIRFSKAIDENIALGGLTSEERQKGEYFSPDGIMEFRHGAKNYVFIEQDMSTETREKLTEKNMKYGQYFDGNAEAAVTTLMYNVSLSNRDKHSVNAQKLAKDIAVSEHEIVKKFYDEAGGNLYQAYLHMGGRLKEWESGRRKSRKPRYFEAAFISLDNAQRASGKAWGELTFADYEKFSNAEKERSLAKTKEERTLSKLRSRMYDIRQAIISALDTDESLLRSAYMGLGIVVTNTYHYQQYKHYLLPMAKGLSLKYQGAFYDSIAGLKDIPHTYRYSPAGMFNGEDGRFVLKNRSSALNSKGLVLADFYLEEISADLGGNLRAAHFLNYCGRVDKPTYLILLVGTDKDAVSLCDRTDFVEKYADVNDVRRPNRNGLSVLFVNYVENSSKIFAVGRNGEKFYL